MGFFDKLFKHEKKEEVKEEHTLESAEKILKGKIEEGQKIIEPELKEFHRKLLELDNQLKESLKKLDSAVPKDKMDEKLLFAAQTGRPIFKNKMSKVSEAVKKQIGFDFHSFSEYYNECVFAVNQANVLAITEFRTIGIVFEKDGNAVVNNLRKLKEYLSSIGSRIKEHQQTLNPHEEAMEKIVELRKSVEKRLDDKKRNQELKNEMEKKNVELEEMKKSVEDFMNSDEWKENENSLKSKKDLEMHEAEIKAQFNEMISSIERPLRKTKRIVDEDQEENKHRKVFEEYINNPFETFLKDEGDALNSLLKTTRKLLEERKIDVNENVREKSINKIDEWISGKVFEKMKEEYGSVIKKIEVMDIENDLQIKKSEMENRIKFVEAEIAELKKKSETMEKKMEEDGKLVLEKKKEAEDKLGEVLNHHYELEVNY